MKKFEYRVTCRHYGNVEEYLKEVGLEGWELCHYGEDNSPTRFIILKREVIDQPQHEDTKENALKDFSWSDLQEELNRRYKAALPYNIPNSI